MTPNILISQAYCKSDIEEKKYAIMFFTTNGKRLLMKEHVCMLSPSVMSDSLWPYGPYPTRILCPWHSPGKNTRVGYHFLLQRIFLTQGSNPHFLLLLHCWWILYPLSHLESPFNEGEFPLFIHSAVIYHSIMAYSVSDVPTSLLYKCTFSLSDSRVISYLEMRISLLLHLLCNFCINFCITKRCMYIIQRKREK